MKHLKTYESMTNTNYNNTDLIDSFLKTCCQGTWKVDEMTGLVDVEGDFDLSYESDLKSRNSNFFGVRFGKVTGNFVCDSAGLTTLQGCPNYVGGDFNCSYNPLTSLKGGPLVVGGDYYADGLEVVDFEELPLRINGQFVCDNIKLKEKVNLSLRKREVIDQFPYEPKNVQLPSSETRENREKSIKDKFPYYPTDPIKGDVLSREEREKQIITTLPPNQPSSDTYSGGNKQFASTYGSKPSGLKIPIQDRTRSRRFFRE